MALLMSATLQLCILSAVSQLVPDVLSGECEDYVHGGGITCMNLPNFCVKGEAQVICRRFCGFCDLNCDFERQTMCAWSVHKSSLYMDWIVDSALAGGQSGGPGVDHTVHTGDGHYLVTSPGSGGNMTVSEAVLVSRPLNNSRAYCLRFWYQFTSRTVGEISVQRQVPGDRTHVLRVTKASDTRGRDDWHLAMDNVPAHSADYSLLIVAYTGGAAGAQIAIDDITLTAGHCPITTLPATTATTTTTITTTTTTTTTVPETTQPHPQTHTEYHCEGHWTLYHNFCYRISGGQHTWNESHEICRSMSAYIVEPRSGDINRLVMNLTHSQGWNSHDIWVGLEETALQHEFLWASSHTPLHRTRYEPWSAGQPKVTQGQPNCVHMNIHDGTWAVGSCDARFQLMCEKRAQQTVVPLIG